MSLNTNFLMSQFYLKNKLNNKAVFCVWLEIHRSYQFTQSFRVGVVRHAQSDSKQEVCCIPEKTLRYKVDVLDVVRHT